MSDLRDAFRTLRATPVVTIVALLSLALGIGANTAIFSIVDALLVRALPVEEPDRLALINRGEDTVFSSWTNPIWEQIRARDDLFEAAFAFGSPRFNLSHGGQTDFVDGLWASGEFFSGLGVSAILGRTFGPADDRRGGGPDGPVTVISYDYWQRRFGGAADALGQSIAIERVPFTIVGVTPPGFFGPDVGRRFDVAIPIGTEPLVRGRESRLDRRSHWWLSIMVRLKEGQSRDAGQQALRGVQPQIRVATLPEHYRPEDAHKYLAEPFILKPGGTGVSFLRFRYQRPVITLMVVVGLVLLIACANIANLLLARASARQHEFSVRRALGASRWRLARQLLAESLLLSAAGGAAGLLVALWGSRVLVGQLSTQTTLVYLHLSPDWRILGFTAAVAVGTALLFGIVPALGASRSEPMDAIREHGRGVLGDRRIGLGSALVAGQIALSLVLIVAAGLFLRTFGALATLDVGFDRDPVLVVGINAQRSTSEPGQRAALYDRVNDVVRALPGVQNAAASAVTPVSGSTWNTGIQVQHEPDRAWPANESYVNLVSPGWFATYGTRLVAGRDIESRDGQASPHVVVVNEAFVRKFFKDGRALGRVIREREVLEPNPWMEIVGIASDAVYRSLRDPVPPTIYKAMAQTKEVPSSMSVSVRAAGGSPAMLSRAVTDAIGQIDRDLALTFIPLKQQVDAALTQERIVAMLSGFFGALALLLAGLGLYGVTSYAVNRRRTEIGIRMALGASPRNVVRLVLQRVAVMVIAGVVAGAIAAVWASRFVEALLYGLTPRDMTTFVAAALILATVGALAGWLPARRGSRIDPARVLREEG